ncbi:hypothetical protein [Devosia sp.]|uniref:hypothetical protein n=1 Tax=Devosia sp. TaxID=1871048 RepID=UPI0025E744A9|nr:hypothetical protein [Devosia sp.]MCR6636674.1 hypothetical protein [Devosia sp.]
MSQKPIVAIIDGGQHYHHDSITREPFKDFFDHVIYLRDVAKTDLSAFDILIIPCRTNAYYLAPLSGQLQAFLRGGGTLVAMGETFPDTWLPGIGFRSMPTNFWWWLTPGADLGLRMTDPSHAICRYLGKDDVTFHLHGAFEPLHPNQKSLVETSEGECQMFEDVISYAPGRLVATTLDPFFHHGAFFMPATTRMLAGMLHWLIDTEAERKSEKAA